jgi:hypothetical protein
VTTKIHSRPSAGYPGDNIVHEDVSEPCISVSSAVLNSSVAWQSVVSDGNVTDNRVNTAAEWCSRGTSQNDTWQRLRAKGLADSGRKVS